MADDPSIEITSLLKAIRDGQPTAADRLYAQVYVQLRQMARRHMRGERKDHSLQPSDLIHEAFLRLVQDCERDLNGRRHFFALASTIMRRILVDHARAKRAARRDFNAAIAGALDHNTPDQTIQIDQALERLARINNRQARVVEMRFFGGLTEDEIAEVLGITTRTVKRDWFMARAWLFGELGGRPPDNT